MNGNVYVSKKMERLRRSPKSVLRLIPTSSDWEGMTFELSESKIKKVLRFLAVVTSEKKSESVRKHISCKNSSKICPMISALTERTF